MRHKMVVCKLLKQRLAFYFSYVLKKISIIYETDLVNGWIRDALVGIMSRLQAGKQSNRPFNSRQEQKFLFFQRDQMLSEAHRSFCWMGTAG
jgi:hypothetical protein